MKFSYVLPEPAAYSQANQWEADVACVKEAGYRAVELQITDPALFDEDYVHRTLDRIGLPMCAFQTGSTYYSRGNCLSTADAEVRQRTIGLLKSFVDLAARWHAVIVFGLLQGRLCNEPDRVVGSARIREALEEIGRYASDQGATLAFEPVTQLEVGFHNTIAEVAAVVRQLNLPGLRMMVDTFHINIEERDLLAPLDDIRDLLVHVHLTETNRGALGDGHWPTALFLDRLMQLGYQGYSSIGVYNSRRSRHECIQQGMAAGTRCS